ncbi:hypothetical protein PCANC_00961 [Puccinia coronata f. sp. avenae]|uniref:Uncharacterized protein n=1 Tax=Puccinia coronata f. sp. avenae TaxID=200324 RepID=A0A2N5W6K5_9BASI|nr:hypothetical protein PCANC_00961 [Puccinia coronata f. sp. avenae]
MIDSSWFNSPPAAWSTDQGFLPNTPSPITVEHPQPEVKPLYKFEDLDELAPAAPHATYPFTDLIPNHQIHALLERNHNPALFDRYAFSNNDVPAFYESVASHFVRLCNGCPPCTNYKCHRRAEHFRFMTRRYHSFNRVVC